MNAQGDAMANRASPKVDTTGVNFVAGGAGNSLHEADATNLLTDASAAGLVGTASGAAATGQMTAANALMGATMGQGSLGQLSTANAMADAAKNGAGYKGQIGAADALTADANGAAFQNQMKAAQQLQALGQKPAGPSVAELQLKAGADASMKQQMAMAAGARGGNAGLALQNAAMNQGEAMGQMNQSQALLRAQEDLNNRQFTANTLTGSANILNQAGAMQGNLLGQAGQTYGSAGALQSNLYSGAEKGYTDNGQLTSQLINSAEQGYTNAATTEQNAFKQAGDLTNDVATNQVNQGGVQADIAKTYAGMATTQAGIDEAQNTLNQQGQLTSETMGIQTQQADRDALLQYIQMQNNVGLQKEAIQKNYDKDIALQNNNFEHQLIGGIVGGAGAIGGFFAGGPAGAAAGGAAGYTIGQGLSDIRSKKDIQPAGDDVSDLFRTDFPSRAPMVSSLPERAPTFAGRAPMARSTPNPGAVFGRYGTPDYDYGGQPASSPATVNAPTFGDGYPDAPAYSYKYKNPQTPGARPGINYGPMAQDLEKTPAGASVVGKKNGRKYVDTGRLSMITASEVAKQRREIDALFHGTTPSPSPSYQDPYTAASYYG
jgi:hypothetical protein